MAGSTDDGQAAKTICSERPDVGVLVLSSWFCGVALLLPALSLCVKARSGPGWIRTTVPRIMSPLL
jgi:uncharacterized membrane protein YhaH (DUF805 family)